MKRYLAISILAVLSIVSMNATADELADIKSSGTLTCGVFGDLVPLGFQDPKTRSLVGFDVDVCAAIAKDLGVKLALKTLSVEARIPALQTGRVNVVAAAMGYTAEREKQIAFSSSYIQVPIPLLVMTKSGINSLADLKGKKVSAISASTSAMFAQRKLPNSQIVAFNDGPSAFLALVQGKVQAMAISQGAGIGFRNRSNGTVRFLKEPVHWEFDSIGVKLGEPALLSAVNAALDKIAKTGQLQHIWDKWYGIKTEYKLTQKAKLVPLNEFENK